LTPNVPPPSHFELAARAAMTTNKPGLLKLPIIFKGTLPNLWEDFDARTGHNPPPEAWKDERWKEEEYEKILEGSLRGVEFDEWNSSWLLRMAQMKKVEIEISDPHEGEAMLADYTAWRLKTVQRDEAAVAKKEAEEGKDKGGRWAHFEGSDKEVQTYIHIEEETDTLHDIKKKVVAVLRRYLGHFEESEVSLWLSAVTWETKPSRLVRWAGRNAERDDGYWLGLYVYRLSEKGIQSERERNASYLELRAKGRGLTR
jgi:hypothetical protein